jgi:hypothetical protein
MVPERLKPRLELVREEYVLVQAWKKTASYIRYHNWFSDTLALDRASVNLPTFIGGLRERLQCSESWQNDPLRIVPAPKSQRWRVREDVWEPVEGATWEQIRPLAHVGLADQVLATALMLCLADRIETMQADPRLPVSHQESRRQVISYGNRLFCDAIGSELRHRWGSAKLYRAYYQDYRTFLSRPEVAAESISAAGGRRLYVVHADLQQFYDRVRPDLLAEAIDRVRRDDDDPSFFSLAASVLDWGWHSRDVSDVRIYAEQANLEDFTRVALPQGLVGSGFFANIVLLPLDDALRAAIGTEIAPGIRVADSCRYVDDFRILVAVAPKMDGSLNDLGNIVATWLGQLLDESATGLALSPKKIQVAALGGAERLVRQGAKMKRIQSAVSGGFDALGGEAVLDAIQGLMRAQEALRVWDDTGWRHSPVPDVRDETVARFRAARYRTTFRSIRPLLQDDEEPGEFDAGRDETLSGGRLRVVRKRHALDDDARAFALGLIQQWIGDPSNVRLLRIGLDLWPDVELLRDVLALLRPFAGRGDCLKAPWRVAWYCLAEVMRAGATETGLVADTESLPSGIDLESYREELRLEAERLAALPGRTIPWYLRQQALLFLAASDPNGAPVANTEPETLHYRELIQFLRGEGERVQSSDFATCAVLARRAFVDRVRAVQLTQPGLSPSRKRQLAQRDPSFLIELSDTERDAGFFDDLPLRVREDLCRISESSEGDYETLAKAVLNAHPTGSLRNELSLLRFAMAFLEQWEQQESPPEVVTPGQVALELGEDQAIADVENLQILPSRADTSGSLYGVAAWCQAGERWRFQLGFLLRFILSGQPDFTRSVRRTGWRETEACYRPVENHWYQRMYGLFSGQPAFGDDWLPITEWVEGFLVALLRWPGCSAPKGFSWVEQGCEAARTRIGERIAYLEQRRGSATRALILPLLAKRPTRTTTDRPLRACVVQTAIPASNDFQRTDLRLDGSAIRRKHRNHLSAALAAVERMLALRATHKGEGLLDWLILPELAVHPQDVRTHLIPFARAHRAMILTGLTYDEILSGQPLVNSALWVIPEWSAAYGLQIRTRRQGKRYLAPDEDAFNGEARVLQGFRPCQWLIGYPWSSAAGTQPVWLTAAVCYDATDFGLAVDLKEMSDVVAIPALNTDVKTFDQMALALHYHMFQLVVVANNGQYGGSSAYWPSDDPYIRQVFHMHGQEQASIAFLEIDDIAGFQERSDVSGASADDWKHPPAGLSAAASGGAP